VNRQEHHEDRGTAVQKNYQKTDIDTCPPIVPERISVALAELAGEALFPDCTVERYEGCHHLNTSHQAEPERVAAALKAAVEPLGGLRGCNPGSCTMRATNGAPFSTWCPACAIAGPADMRSNHREQLVGRHRRGVVLDVCVRPTTTTAHPLVRAEHLVFTRGSGADYASPRICRSAHALYILTAQERIAITALGREDR
jgi:hypothetical protein